MKHFRIELHTMDPAAHERVERLAKSVRDELARDPGTVGYGYHVVSMECDTDQMIEAAAKRACEFMSNDNWDSIPDNNPEGKNGISKFYKFDYRGLATAMLAAADDAR